VLVRKLVVGVLETNCWVITDDLGGPAIVLDPAGDASAVLEAVGERDIAAIVLTHNHFDHIGAVRELMERSGAPLFAHAVDADGLSDPVATCGAMFGFDDTTPEPDRLLYDEDVIEAGTLQLVVLHTPGHTAGSISLYGKESTGAPPRLFSGDTVFAGSVGRTDFPGGDSRALATSIASKIAVLPAETIVHPGHGPDTTVGREQRLNPFFSRA
jgi:glyoxylase-like metal-dependent hydrolase (beta-lactamase superfamily II)